MRDARVARRASHRQSRLPKFGNIGAEKVVSVATTFVAFGRRILVWMVALAAVGGLAADGVASLVEHRLASALVYALATGVFVLLALVIDRIKTFLGE